MQAVTRRGKLASWFRRSQHTGPRESKPGTPPAAGDLPDHHSLMKGLTKHAGPAWVISPDLQTVTANPAARAHIEAHAAKMAADRRQSAHHQVNNAYRQALLSALREAAGPPRTVTPGQSNSCLPQRLTCSVGGRPLDLLFLEVRGPYPSTDPRRLPQPADRTIAYLLVA